MILWVKVCVYIRHKHYRGENTNKRNSNVAQDGRLKANVSEALADPVLQDSL